MSDEECSISTRATAPGGVTDLGADDTPVGFDSVGLSYRVRGGQIHVSYPIRRAAVGSGHGTGLPLGTVLPTYWTEPPNAITAERVALWAALLARS
jgi:hypothetical protein